MVTTKLSSVHWVKDFFPYIPRDLLQRKKNFLYVPFSTGEIGSSKL